MKSTKRLLIGLIGATALSGMFASASLAWEPTKPVDFVIMAGAGGGADQIARFLQSVAEKKILHRAHWFLTTRAAVQEQRL